MGEDKTERLKMQLRGKILSFSALPNHLKYTEKFLLIKNIHNFDYVW